MQLEEVDDEDSNRGGMSKGTMFENDSEKRQKPSSPYKQVIDQTGREDGNTD